MTQAARRLQASSQDSAAPAAQGTQIWGVEGLQQRRRATSKAQASAQYHAVQRVEPSDAEAPPRREEPSRKSGEGEKSETSRELMLLILMTSAAPRPRVADSLASIGSAVTVAQPRQTKRPPG
eukprot:CAMPEP_0171124152 /NCGR_PEP_ID=MMETSP0766_2-20121228/108609_1 /TAXON_ID=439317 /ORGANISM="Gambierdiscus australes, Strain CAWD 149" /LENGTH=122 /DNA_ID=CAMNT_0011587057 /DNA_START=319 /DNA_END=687 /DNA_ORIENTATION=+